MEHFKSIEVDSVAILAVPVDVDESIATEVEVVQQMPGPVAVPGVDSLRAEARESGAAGKWCRGLPKVT